MQSKSTTRIQRRISNEVQGARDAGFNIQEQYHPSTNDIIAIIVKMNFIGLVTIRFAPDHPFKPPRININGQSLHEAMMFKSHSSNKRYSELMGGECLCCDLEFMGSKWSPSIVLSSILISLRDMQDRRHYVRYEKIVDAIQETRGIPEDLPIIMEYVGKIHR